MTISTRSDVPEVSGTPRVPRAWLSFAVKAGLIFVATLLVLYFRRPDQFYSPYIWVEDGTVSLPQYISHGWLYLFDPVAGYLIIPSKLIQATALSLSASNYPELALWLTVAFHAGVLSAIAFSPTTLRLPLVCALFTLFIPTDSEVFGTSHYAFWWGSLLLIPPLLWRYDAGNRIIARIAMVVLGGLSSPLVVALSPLYVVRLLIHRSRNEFIVAGAVAACSAIQLYFVCSSGTHGSTFPDHLPLDQIVTKFFGYFVYWSPDHANQPVLLVGVALLCCMAAAAFTARKSLQWRHFSIAGALGVSILISVVRMPTELIDPFLAGPRYFFYPYIFLGWLLIELIPVAHKWMTPILLVFLLTGLGQFARYAPRGHHAVDWREQLQHCSEAKDTYKFPVHFAGNRNDAWAAYLSPADCRNLMENSLLR